MSLPEQVEQSGGNPLEVNTLSPVSAIVSKLEEVIGCSAVDQSPQNRELTNRVARIAEVEPSKKPGLAGVMGKIQDAASGVAPSLTPFGKASSAEIG